MTSQEMMKPYSYDPKANSHELKSHHIIRCALTSATKASEAVDEYSPHQ
jgi:hypothetical protein